MTALYCIAWATAAVAMTWAIMTARSSALISRLKAETHREISRWQDEASRARITAAQVAKDAATRARAWEEGRDDVVAMIPLILSARDGNVAQQLAADDGSTTT